MDMATSQYYTFSAPAQTLLPMFSFILFLKTEAPPDGEVIDYFFAADQDLYPRIGCEWCEVGRCWAPLTKESGIAQRSLGLGYPSW